MRVASTQFSLSNKAFEIYLSGCLGPHCPNCHNSELWRFNQGRTYQEALPGLIDKINKYRGLIDQLWILGGDPCDQSTHQLVDFLTKLGELNIPIVMFTRKELQDISTPLKNKCDYIKTGRYDETLLVDDYVSCGIKLASSNQKVHCICEW